MYWAFSCYFSVDTSGSLFVGDLTGIRKAKDSPFALLGEQKVSRVPLFARKRARGDV